MVPLLCRCGATPARRCAACGCELTANGVCPRHPAMNVETIRCLHCKKPLCFWHYVLQPEAVEAAGKTVTVLRQACFPGCAHEFQTAEWKSGLAQ